MSRIRLIKKINRENNMFSIASSVSSSAESSITVKKLHIELLKWEECDTAGKKIGFYVGSGINWAVLTTDKAIRKAVQVLHLDAVARFCLRILNSIKKNVTLGINKIMNLLIRPRTTIVLESSVRPGRVVVRPKNQLIQSIVELLQKIKHFFSPLCSKVSNFSKVVWNNLMDGIEKCKPTFNKIADKIIVPFNDKVLCPIRKYVLEALKICKEALRTFKNRTLIPFYQNTLTPVGQKISRFFREAINRYSKPCGEALKKIADWTIVPLYNHVLSPAGTFLKDFFNGVLGGGLGKKDDKSKPVQAKVNIDDPSKEVSEVEEGEESSESDTDVDPEAISKTVFMTATAE